MFLAPIYIEQGCLVSALYECASGDLVDDDSTGHQCGAGPHEALAKCKSGFKSSQTVRDDPIVFYWH